MKDTQSVTIAHVPDDGGFDLPPCGYGEHRVNVGRGHEGHHAFLGLGHEQLGSRHPLFAQMDGVEIEVHSNPCPRGRLTCSTAEPCCAEILHSDDETTLVQFEARLDEFLLFVRVTCLF